MWTAWLLGGVVTFLLCGQFCGYVQDCCMMSFQTTLVIKQAIDLVEMNCEVVIVEVVSSHLLLGEW